ncbi:B12-binding domain-containing protein [Chloroflexota bacterium]
MSSKLVTALVNLQEDEALQIVNEEIDKGENPYNILNDCQEAMEIVGQNYEKGEYYVPELIMSGEMLKKISNIVRPKLASAKKVGEGSVKLGKVVIGTVHGDVHDIGKDIVALILDVNGFEVHDLGVDVAQEKFVEAVKELKPQIVAMSGFLTLAYDAMKSAIEALDKAGLRKDVKVMIGGGQINDMVNTHTKADGWGINAMTAVRLAKEWVPGK